MSNEKCYCPRCKRMRLESVSLRRKHDENIKAGFAYERPASMFDISPAKLEADRSFIWAINKTGLCIWGNHEQ